MQSTFVNLISSKIINKTIVSLTSHSYVFLSLTLLFNLKDIVRTSEFGGVT
jgi:hypothetical protein